MTQNRFKLVEKRQGACGCPEEEWLVDGCTLMFHVEPWGEIDMLVFRGDWVRREQAPYLGDPRSTAFRWATKRTPYAPSELAS